MRWFDLARGLIVGSMVFGGVAQSQILIGQTACFSGPVAAGVKETTAGAKLYLNVGAKAGAALSPAMLEGFAAAKKLMEGLQRAGSNPTREKLRTALDGIKCFNLGGLEVGYGPEDHTSLDFVDLSIVGADGRFMR